jgi:DNA repair protein RadC
VHVREVFQVAMQAGAAAVACVRVQYSNAIQPGLADGRLLWNLHEAAKYLEILFVDYLITELDGCAFYAYSQHRRDHD